MFIFIENKQMKLRQLRNSSTTMFTKKLAAAFAQGYNYFVLYFRCPSLACALFLHYTYTLDQIKTIKKFFNDTVY